MKKPGIFSRIPPIFWVLLVVIALLGIASPNSVKPVHLLDFSRQSAPLIIVSLGQTIVMLVGGIDLSNGSVMTAMTLIAAREMAGKDENAVATVAICLGIGILVGAINGFFTTRFKLPGFIVTYAMSIIILGASLTYCRGVSSGKIAASVRFWANGFILGIPAATFVWLPMTVLVILIMHYTPIGRLIYGTGMNERAVGICGYNVTRIKFLAYVASGFLAACAGLMMAAYIGLGSTTVGASYSLNSITAAVLGGAAFTGGVGSFGGTIIASLFVMVLNSFVSAIKISIGWRTSIVGVVIILGMVLNNYTAKRTREMQLKAQ